jgi:hypothetical protein
MLKLDRPRVRVEFSEMAYENLLLLSTSDYVLNSDGEKITLTEGMRVYLYQDDSDDNGNPSYLVATGLAEVNVENDWSAHVKWCCRIDEWGEVTSSS